MGDEFGTVVCATGASVVRVEGAKMGQKENIEIIKIPRKIFKKERKTVYRVLELLPGAHTWPFPFSPIDPSQPLLVSHQPFLQHNPEPHQLHGPCRLPQPPQQSLPPFNNSFR